MRNFILDPDLARNNSGMDRHDGKAVVVYCL